MKIINAKIVRLLSKEYAKQIHGGNYQVSQGYLLQINQLVEAVVRSSVAKQEDLAGTLRETQWADKCIMDANNQLEEYKNESDL
jgi:hypothetical protein